MNNNFLKDSDLLIPVAAGTLLITVLILFVIYFVVLYKRKQQAFEWEREQFKQALLKTEIEIQEQTLSNISRELHDNFGQIASLIKINLSLVSKQIPGDDKDKIDESLTLLKGLITDIKSLSISLKGENLKRFGLSKMIEDDTKRLQKLGYFNITLTNLDLLPEFNPEVEIFLYRMTQEIFNNMIQHANASDVSLKIQKKDQICNLTFKDNGKGFDTTTKKFGSGLINLYERSEMIGADIEIKSQIDSGTEISISLKS